MGHSAYSEREVSLLIQKKGFWQQIRQLFTSPLLYSGYALGLDGSHYVQVDWDVLAANVDFVIWKASEGASYQDETFAGACQAAYDHAMPFSAYHFFRIDPYLGLPFPSSDEVIDKYWPSPAADSQLQNMIHCLANKAVTGLYVDIEATKELDSGNLINPLWASKAAKIFVGRAWDWWKVAHPGKPFGIYTSNGYISSYAPDMANWAGNYDNWVAQWAVYPQSAVTISWAQAKSTYLPADTARPRPFGTGTAYLWQYTGDRLIVPGVTTNDGRNLPRTCDLNLFMGTKAQMLDYFAYTPFTPPPPPPPPPPDQDTDLALVLARLDQIQDRLEHIADTLDKNQDTLAHIAATLDKIHGGLVF